jgi:DNA polymerase-1
LAKCYQSIFKASPGFKLVNCDLSQIELRIAAWMAHERTMLDIYRSGGDIHTATAKYVNGLNDERWNALPASERKLLRFKATPVKQETAGG